VLGIIDEMSLSDALAAGADEGIAGMTGAAARGLTLERAHALLHAHLCGTPPPARCPGGHALEAFLAAERIECDGCGRRVPAARRGASATSTSAPPARRWALAGAVADDAQACRAVWERTL
jgi:hypothetical protein